MEANNETPPLHQAEAASANAAKGQWLRYGLPLTLVALTFLAYGRSLTYQFVYDDHLQIGGQAHALHWSFAPRYFTENLWEHLYPGEPGSFYRPVFMLWLLIQYSLFGLNPFWWHLIALLAHAAVAVLVYRLAVRLTGSQATAALAGGIFALHPIHIEVAVWVSGASESLMALLLIPALLCYLNWREASRRPLEVGDAQTPGRGAISGQGAGWLALSLLLFAASLFAKETAIVLPLLILAYEWLKGELGVAPSALRLRLAAFLVMPYALIVMLYLAARVAALRGFAHPGGSMTFATMIWTLPSVILFYVRSLFFPVQLSACYDIAYVSGPGNMQFWLPLLGLIVITLGIVWWRRSSPSKENRRALSFAFVWMLIALLPVLYLRALYENDMVHDRYLYLPSVGFAILLALAVKRLPSGNLLLFRLPAAQVAATLALALAFGLGTALQHPVWENELTLWSHTLDVVPNSTIANGNLAAALLAHDRADLAVSYFQRVIQLNPNLWEPYYRLGFIYGKLGRPDAAESYLRRAIQINPKRAAPYVYLAFPRLADGRLDEAEELLSQALNLNGRVESAHYGLGLVSKKRGDLRAALTEFYAEMEIQPGLPGLRDQIANVEAMLRRTSSADSRP
jgi:tetratricopeptide (TPR) repeat protein